MSARLDEFLLSSGRFKSRTCAKAAVMAGLVSVDGCFSVKPGTRVKGTEDIQILSGGSGFVSRGGEKLDGALDDLGIDVTGMTAIDVGASTGGFTDCLLQRGAVRVIALDVGKGQLEWKLRCDERVDVIEEFNARYLKPQDLKGKRPDIATVDVSFISLLKVIAPVFGVLDDGAFALGLVKPQFEAGRSDARGGVVRDARVHLDVLKKAKEGLEELGLSMRAVVPSRLKGPKGNVEFFSLIAKEFGGADMRALEAAVAAAHPTGESV